MTPGQGRWRQEEFKVCLSNIVSLRPVRAICHCLGWGGGAKEKQKEILTNNKEGTQVELWEKLCSIWQCSSSA